MVAHQAIVLDLTLQSDYVWFETCNRKPKAEQSNCYLMSIKIEKKVLTTAYMRDKIKHIADKIKLEFMI